VLAPKLERGPLFCGVARSVVDASDASLVAADVIEHGFDDVWLHAKFGHASSDSASYIMQPPRTNRRLLIKCRLGLRPSLKAALPIVAVARAMATDGIPTGAGGARFQDL